MTGAGSAAGPTELGVVTVELRSVNGRGLSVKTRVAAEGQGLETALESRVRSRLSRGTVFLTLAVDRGETDAEPLLDVDLAARVAKVLEELAQRLGKSVALADVLAFPGVVSTQNRTAPRTARDLSPELSALVDTALDDLVGDRVREGAAAAAAVLAEIDRLVSDLAAVTALAPAVVDAYRSKLLGRVNEFLAGRARAMEDSDVIREVAMFADRVDITEELQRLGSHAERARDLVRAGGTVDRPLEFLVQEIHREVNTIGSKSPDVAIAHRVIEMKSAVDRLKEQAANLE
jgi:uncharacterized protein (TIGR00255 family)